MDSRACCGIDWPEGTWSRAACIDGQRSARMTSVAFRGNMKNTDKGFTTSQRAQAVLKRKQASRKLRRAMLCAIKERSTSTMITSRRTATVPATRASSQGARYGDLPWREHNPNPPTHALVALAGLLSYVQLCDGKQCRFLSHMIPSDFLSEVGEWEQVEK